MSDPIQIEGDVGARLSEILGRLNNPRSLLATLGRRLGQQSVRTTFARGGRPAWSRPKYRDGQRGRDTGRLMNSFTSGSPGEIFELGTYQVQFGTNVEYAGTQNYGAEKGEYGSGMVTVAPFTRRNKSGGTSNVRGHQRMMQFPFGKIEALNFMALHPEDVEDFRDVADQWIMEGRDG